MDKFLQSKWEWGSIAVVVCNTVLIKNMKMYCMQRSAKTENSSNRLMISYACILPALEMFYHICGCGCMELSSLVHLACALGQTV